jgi:cobaltochelatase CobN
MFRILFIFSGDDCSYSLREARMEIAQDSSVKIDMNIFDSYELDQDEEQMMQCMELARESDFIFISIGGGITYFKGFDRIMRTYEGKKKFFIYSGVEDENTALLKNMGIAPFEYGNILKYYRVGGMKNSLNMILYIAAVFGGYNCTYEDVEMLPCDGIYHPRYSEEEVKDMVRQANEEGSPVIGILFYSKYFHENNVLHIDALIEEIEKQGGTVLPVYITSFPDASIGSKGIIWTIHNLLMHNGKSAVNVLINTIAYSQSIMGSPGDGRTVPEKSVFEELGIPVLQAMVTYQDLESWKQSVQGLIPMFLCASIYYPEFDGQLITAPIGYVDVIMDKAGKKCILRPINERVRKICSLAMNWVKLQHTAPQDKRVAIIFHNMPPRNDMIGCAYGLDSPASVFNILNVLKSQGVYIEHDYQDGDDIIRRIISAVSNDKRWLSAQTVLDRSAAVIEGDIYREWFDELPQKVRKKMKLDWGNPPGDFLVYEDKLPVPGIINGNVFIGLQPARGYEEKADEAYHSTDMVPPHQYIAYYRWIKHVFGAHVIVHVGTHGTLEWLPGKETGFSGDCYPDIAIDDIPHLYPYIINVPGEGMQVKRRSYGIVIDHMIPSMTLSGSYEHFAEIEELVRQYYSSKHGDSGKLPELQKLIIEKVLKNDLHKDLNTGKNEMERDFSAFIGKLHSWVEEIKGSFIKDGLHIFGKAPKGKRLKNLIYSMLQLPNGEVPSLSFAVSRAMGLDLEYLRDHPDEENEAGKTSLMTLNEISDVCIQLMEEYSKGQYNLKTADEIISKLFPYSQSDGIMELKKCFRFISEDMLPKLQGTKDELKYFEVGLNGKFIPPGGSGCPTRGRVNILPTGRNFYSIDPTAIPTRASWEVGVRLGNDLMDRYLKEEGKYPESIAIVVYAGETMKTCGDDVAETLYLMGIKPVWLGDTGKVIGIEPIPDALLKRPRIDVTLRISGLFRDTFPNLIELIDDAVQMAAGLEEEEVANYIRRHVVEEVEELVNKGVDEEEARTQAGMRIFGCPAGTYGAGVDILINSRNWENNSDLGGIYTLWGGNAYGRKIHGLKVREVFARRLAGTELTVKNESSMEIDILDDDDFYNYHGGLIAAVRTCSGKRPRSYCGNSSDPSRTKIKDVREETARIMRARIMNPKWFEGLKVHGYKGAQEISSMVDIVFGWDATADNIEDWMYDKISENYLFNEERREWIESVNPWAIHSIVERLLEANQRGMWNAALDTVDKLKELYLGIEGSIEEVL